VVADLLVQLLLQQQLLQRQDHLTGLLRPAQPLQDRIHQHCVGNDLLPEEAIAIGDHHHLPVPQQHHIGEQITAGGGVIHQMRFLPAAVAGCWDRQPAPTVGGGVGLAGRTLHWGGGRQTDADQQ